MDSCFRAVLTATGTSVDDYDENMVYALDRGSNDKCVFEPRDWLLHDTVVQLEPKRLPGETPTNSCTAESPAGIRAYVDDGASQIHDDVRVHAHVTATRQGSAFKTTRGGDTGGGGGGGGVDDRYRQRRQRRCVRYVKDAWYQRIVALTGVYSDQDADGDDYRPLDNYDVDDQKNGEVIELSGGCSRYDRPVSFGCGGVGNDTTRRRRPTAGRWFRSLFTK
jgi:hypothetical protein